MKVFLAVLVLIFSLQSWTKADDIRDFQIEGMSIGDSALDYFTKAEIKKKKQFIFKDKKFTFVDTYPDSSLKTYDGLQFLYKTKDKNYTLVAIAGVIDFHFDKKIDQCYKKKDQIVKELSSFFGNTATMTDEGTTKYLADPSGKSTITAVHFYFDNSGNRITVRCTDWSDDKPDFWDHLKVLAETKEFSDWVSEQRQQ